MVELLVYLLLIDWRRRMINEIVFMTVMFAAIAITIKGLCGIAGKLVK